MLKKCFPLALVLFLVVFISGNVVGAPQGGGGGITTVPTPIWVYPGQKADVTFSGNFTAGVKSVKWSGGVSSPYYTVLSDASVECELEPLTPGIKLGIFTSDDDSTSMSFIVAPATGLRLKINEKASSVAQEDGTFSDALTACYADSEKMIAVGSYGKLYISYDQGKNIFKSILGSTNTQFPSMRFYNSLIGYAGGFVMSGGVFGPVTIAPVIYKTTDGWKNSTAQTLPDPANAQYLAVTDIAIAPDDPNRVWAVCASSQTKSPTENLYRSTDGGATWTLLNIETGSDFPVPLGIDVVKNGANYNVYVVGAPSQTALGYITKATLVKSSGGVKGAAGGGAPPPPPPPQSTKVLFTSTANGDDGSWTASNITTDTNVAPTVGIRIKMFNANKGYVTAAKCDDLSGDVTGYLLKYTGNWAGVKDISPTNPNTWSVDGTDISVTMLLAGQRWLNENVGIVMGPYGAIFKTLNGGQSWEYLAFEYRTGFDGAIIDENNIWVVGGGMGVPIMIPATLTQTQQQMQQMGGLSVKAAAAQQVGGSSLPLGSFGLKTVVNPTIASLSPDSAVPGETKTVTFTGSNLMSGASLELGSDILVDRISATGTAATALITPIKSDTVTATEGARVGTWTNEDDGYTSFTFTVSSAPITPPITIPIPTKKAISKVTPTKGIEKTELNMSLFVTGLSTGNTVNSVTLKNPRTGKTLIYPGSAVTVKDGVISLPLITPTSDLIGDVYASVVIDGESLAYDAPVRIEPAAGFLALYPTPLPESALTGAAAAATQPRIAFTLSAAKNIEIIIIDPREAKVIFRRKVTAAEGYNEILWDGKTDFGNITPAGSYIMQLVSDGKVSATYPFVVVGRRP